MTVEVKALLDDARSMYSSAIERLEQDDIRDAAEKAWCATLRAVNALILARTGIAPERTPETSKGLDSLLHSDSRLNHLEGRYYSRQTRLHGDCFYLGIVEPREMIERRIRETQDYIADIEEAISWGR